MSAVLRLPVGVVVERRKASSPWIDYLWRPAAVLSGEAEAKAWTMLDGDAETARFYAGGAILELHAGDASSYRDNLATGAARLRPATWHDGSQNRAADVAVRSLRHAVQHTQRDDS